MHNTLATRGLGGEGQDCQLPAISDQPSAILQDKLKEVYAILDTCEHVMVAFSGGVDSTVLAKLARDRLGKVHVFVVTADSPSLARADLQEACQLARRLDFQHLVIETNEVSNPSYRENNPSRCYLCKAELFKELQDLAKRQNIPVVLYGAIGEDLLSERPGQRAARECDVRAPLQEAGFAKWEVRQLARWLGLPNWDRPQNACLSSRIPHGQEVTEEKLKQIEVAEAILHASGFRQVRVRHRGTHAKIEVGRNEVARWQDVELYTKVMEQFATLGFTTVGVDPAGYRAGGGDAIERDEILLKKGE